MDVARLDANQAPAPVQAPPQPRVVGEQGQQEPAHAAPADSRPGDMPEAPGLDSLRRAVTSVNTSIASHMRHLSINVHQATGRHIVTVYDSETNQAIREIPPERVLDAHASILEIAGLFVDRRG